MSEHTPLTEALEEAIREASISVAPFRSRIELAAFLAARTSTAIADAGLRERVEALADWCEREEAELVVWYGHEQCTVNSAAKKLRAIIDATAAPATDTGARDE